MQRNIFFLLSFLLILILFLLLRNEKGMRINVQSKDDSFIEGLKIIHKRAGETDWILTANRADITRNGDEAHLNGIEMSMNGKGLTIFADRGIYNLTNRNISIEGKIFAKGDNYSLSTQDIEVSGMNDVLKTKGIIKIEGKKFIIEGKGMEADNSEQKIRILRDVKATFYN